MRRVILVALLLWPLGGLAREAPRSCQQHFDTGQMPDVAPEQGARARLLCRGAFALLHSPRTLTPIWVAEHLTPARVRAADALTRPNPGPFHPDRNLTPGQRSELRDYRGSHFDRGHMAPNGDMPTKRAQTESFSLANMVPQDPCNNQRLWRGLEDTVRRVAQDGVELFVITGPIYAADPPEAIGRGVKVPTHIFKAILNTSNGEAAAYVVLNNHETPVNQVSIAELADLTGIDVFPVLPEAARRNKARLPELNPDLQGCGGQ